MTTATFPTAPAQQAIVPTLVTCSICDRVVPLSETVTYEIMEAIDGNQQNLSAENIRLTGQFGYECDVCLEAEIMALGMTDPHFIKGYHAGVQEAKKGCFNVDMPLTDQEIVSSLRTLFSEYFERPDEKALFHGIGGLVGLLTSVATNDH